MMIYDIVRTSGLRRIEILWQILFLTMENLMPVAKRNLSPGLLPSVRPYAKGSYKELV